MAEQSSMLWFSETALKAAFPKLTLTNGSALNFVPGPGFDPLNSLPLFHALTFPIKHPTTAALISDLNEFNFKEPQMSNEQPYHKPTEERLAVENFAGSHDSKVMKIAEAVNALIEETEFSEAVSEQLDRVLDENASLRIRLAERQSRNLELEARVANQFATIQEFQKKADKSDDAHQLTAEVAHRGAKAAESAEAGLKAQLKGQADHIKALEAKVERLTPQADETVKTKLERALHTQKILERDLEEYQQAYATLKAESFPPDDQLPGRLLAFGHGDYLVYPAKVYAEDDDHDPKWGIIIDPTTDVDVEEYLRPLAGTDVVLMDGDVAITFEKPSDVTRLIDTLTGIVWRMYCDPTQIPFKSE